MEILVLPEPWKMPFKVNWTPRKANEAVRKRTKIVAVSMTAGSSGMKVVTMGRAKIKKITPKASSERKAILSPVLAAASARSVLPAPMFWPTMVETAMERPKAGMTTKLKIRIPIP